MNLSKDIVSKILEFMEGKVNIQNFEQWIYKCDQLSNELDCNEYLKLVEFDFQSKDVYCSLEKVLYELLDKYVVEQKNGTANGGIKGCCITNQGRYKYSKHDMHFKLTEGLTYNIFTIYIKHDHEGNKDIQYIIMDDENRIYYIPSSLLLIESNQLPSDWIVKEDKSRNITIEPIDFNCSCYKGKYSFWEDFHDDRDEALIIFARYLHKHNIQVPERFKLYGFKAFCE